MTASRGSPARPPPSDSRQNANVRILRPVVVELKAWVAPAHVFSWQPPQVYAVNFVHLHGVGLFSFGGGRRPSLHTCRMSNRLDRDLRSRSPDPPFKMAGIRTCDGIVQL